MQLEKMDKWKAVSHLQKCIRRGWYEKIPPVAFALWNVDNAYLRYRLAVILMEDVGIANIEDASELMEDKINKRWVEGHGGIEGLIERMQRVAQGVKDRTPCTWGALASQRAFETLYGPWSDTPIPRAIEIAWDPNNTLEIRAAGALRAAGTDLFPHEAFQSLAGDWNAWLESNVQYANAAVVGLMRQGQKTQKEWHPAFLGMCAEQACSNPLPNIESIPRDFGDVHGYCSAAIDSHTSEGKKAIAQLWYGHPTLRSDWRALDPTCNDATAIAGISSMVFLLEGGAVDKRLGYTTAQRVEQEAKDRWSKRYGVPGKEAATLVWRAMPLLHEFRKSNVAHDASSEFNI